MIIIIVGCYLLKTDFSFFESNNKKSNFNAIGKVDFVKSEVRLKPAKNVFWVYAYNEDAVALGDSIFVGADSSAKVTLKEGQIISLGENSLINFKVQNKSIKLNLQYGSIKTDKFLKDFIIEDCGKSYKLSTDGQALEINKKSKCGHLKFKSKAVKLKINDQSIQLSDSEYELKNSGLELSENPSQTIQSSSSTDQSEIAPTQVAPAKATTALLSFKAPELNTSNRAHLIIDASLLTINWKKNDLAKNGYEIEISESNNFEKRTLISAKSEFIQIDPKKFDQIYYRVRSIATDNSKSSYSNIGFIDINYPRIKLVKQKITLDEFLKDQNELQPDKEFEIKWNRIFRAKKYVIQIFDISGNQNFKNIETELPEAVIKLSEAGNYKFKVSAYNSENKLISTTKSFGEIAYIKLIDLQAPVIEPEHLKMTYLFQKGFGRLVWLKWKSDRPVDQYKIEISRDKNFIDIFKSYSSKKNKFLFSEALVGGSYYWRVRSEVIINQSIKKSNWSEIGYLNITTGQ